MEPYAALALALAVLLVIPIPLDQRMQRMRLTLGVSAPRWHEALTSVTQRIRSRGVRAADARRAALLDLLSALVAELQAGLPPRTALTRAAEDQAQLCPRTLAAARFGGDVVEAMRADADTAPLLRTVAAAWQVGENSGAGLVIALGTLLASARTSEDVRRQLAAQLAAPKATARMLTALPLIGLLMGLLLGGDPLSWLLSTAPGLVCLFGGVALTSLGAWWTHRIALGVQAYA
jgi:tight adherence protein B